MTEWTKLTKTLQIAHPRPELTVIMAVHAPMTKEQIDRMDALLRSMMEPLEKAIGITTKSKEIDDRNRD